MKAILFHQHGGPEVWQYADFPTPEPGPGQALVALRASSLNRLDIWVREGWPGIKLDYPHIPGADGAGEVAAVGPGVTGFAPGDRVVINSVLSDGTCEFCLAGQDNLCPRFGLLGEHRRGTLAEYIAISEHNLLKIPGDFPYEQAAAAALVYHTAWHSLITRGRLQAAETVLIVGAGGGVNSAALQIAKLAGATVWVVGSNAEKCRRARELGADATIDRSAEDW
ncbi:MAG: alcohol dehydrogenase catalytic domain-containing protein, partial [Chloroflexi bacterium]|nr:alcohol dehydrogenase catalytic domain-containing protein [Chloroflexota bacterium]